MLANKALSAAPSAVPVYVEDIFSSYLYTGNGSTQTINNGIDLAGKGGLVWIKRRNAADASNLLDTARGTNSVLSTEYTNAAQTGSSWSISNFAFNSNGASWSGSGSSNNNSSGTYVSWTFAEQAKFFDVVTYTGNGSAPRNISHSLGSSPGFIVIKRTDSTGDWWAWHRSIANKNIYLNYTDAADSGANPMISAVSSTNFTLATNQNATMNINGATYVAYLFAHDAGGFGASGSDNVITCGSFTTDGSGNATIDLGWEPQFIIRKGSTIASNWEMYDNMRGIVAASSSQAAARLSANLSDAEGSSPQISINSTGFAITSGATSQTFIYIAIRRGPMKTPTTGTSVYEGTVRTGTGATASITGLSFPPDFVITRNRPANLNSNWAFFDKLRGTTKYLSSNATTAETTGATSLTSFNQAGETFGDSGIVNGNGDSYINYQMRRAPGFFDEVCYTGSNSTNLRVTHNLGVAPDLIIVKSRESITSWPVYVSSEGRSKYMYLNSTQASTAYTDAWGTSNPTTTDFGINATDFGAGFRSGGQVAYLFASVTGVSKVGSYTGNGSSQTINCGFTAGARFVLIKRTDSTGDWFVYDSARGIVSGNDPQLKLNTTDAEDTGYDAIDPDNSGFIVNNNATNFPINVNAATYIYLAIA